MLKPQRKITRKEIKRDPFLETVDKIEYNFEQNKKTYLKIALGIIAVIIFVNFLLNKQSQKDFDSNSALGIALVAFDNEDYENAKFQFESILSDFSGTNSFNIANYYLGKISFENNELIIAESYLNEYLNNSEPDILIPGTIKILSNIALKNNEFDKAIKLLDRGLRLGLDNNISNEFKLLKVSIFIEQDKTEIAQKIINEILIEKKLPIHLKQHSEELIGMM